MRQFIKSYHVFVPQIWSKLFLYLGYPLLLILVTGKFMEWQIPTEMCVIIACNLIVMVEVLLDSIVFGGIASKDTNKLEYLKTSVRGMSILRKSIIADAVRRALNVAIILGVVYAMDPTGVELIQIITCIFSTLWCAELGLLVTRSFSMMVVMLITMYVVGIISTIVSGVTLTAAGLVWNICFGVVPYILFVVVGRIVIMQKAKGSYYDSRD